MSPSSRNGAFRRSDLLTFRRLHMKRIISLSAAASLFLVAGCQTTKDQRATGEVTTQTAETTKHACKKCSCPDWLNTPGSTIDECINYRANSTFRCGHKRSDHH